MQINLIGNFYFYDGTLAYLRRNPNIAGMKFYNAIRQGQPKPETFHIREIGTPVKRFEDIVEFVWWNADTLICYYQKNMTGICQ